MWSLPFYVFSILSLFLLYFPIQIVIVGESDNEIQTLLQVVHSFYLPHKILIVYDPTASCFLSSHLNILSSMMMKEKRTTAYVCENFTCSAPVHGPKKLAEMIDPTRHLRV